MRIEQILMDTMFRVPLDRNILKCIVTKESAQGKEEPTVIVADGTVFKKPIQKKRSSKKDTDETVS